MFTNQFFVTVTCFILFGITIGVPVMQAKPRLIRSTTSNSVPLITSTTDLETAASYGSYGYGNNYMNPMKYNSFYPSSFGYGYPMYGYYKSPYYTDYYYDMFW